MPSTMKSLPFALLLLCGCVMGQEWNPETSEYPEIRFTSNLTSSSVTYNRFGAPSDYSGRGAMTCDEYGIRHFIASAKLNVYVNGVLIAHSMDSRTSVQDILDQDHGLAAQTPLRTDVFEHSSYSCMQLQFPEGYNIPTFGHIKIEGTFGDASDLSRMGFKNNEKFSIEADYNVAGRRGAQTITLSMGPELERGEHFDSWLDDDMPVYLVGEPASKIAVAPVSGVVDDVLDSMARIFKIEFLVPSSLYETPNPPQIKGVTHNSVTVYLPRKLTSDVIDRWEVSYAGGSQRFYSTPIRGDAGQELRMSGLIPETSYNVLACAVTSQNTTCYRLLAMTSSFAGLQYIPIGIASTFPLESGNGIELSLPSRRCEECDDFESVSVTITKRDSSDLLFQKRYTVPGIFREMGFATSFGYNAVLVYSEPHGKVVTVEEGFRPGMDESKVIARTGTPTVYRPNPTSLVIRVPQIMNGSTTRVKAVHAVLTQARTRELLHEATFTHGYDDFSIDHISFTGAWRLDLDVSDDDTTSHFVYLFNAASENPSSHLFGPPMTTLLKGGEIEIEVPNRLEPDTALLDTASSKALESFTDDVISTLSLPNGGKGTLLHTPRDRTFRVVTETKDLSGEVNVYRSLIVASESSPGLMKEVGTPLIVARTDRSVTVSVPSRTTLSESKPTIEKVTVTAIDSLSRQPITQSIQEGAGMFELEFSPKFLVHEILVEISKGQNVPVESYRLLTRPAGIPPYNIAGKITVLYQTVGNRVQSRTVVVRVPKMVPATTSSGMFAEIQIQDEKNNTLEARTTPPGADIVFQNIDPTRSLKTIVTFDGRTEIFPDASYLKINKTLPVVIQRIDGAFQPLPERQMYGGAYVLPVVDGVVVRVTRYISEGSSIPVESAIITVTESAVGRQGTCIGSQIGSGRYDVTSRSDTHIPLPNGIPVDICIQLKTIRDTVNVNYHVPVDFKGGSVVMKPSGKVEIFPVSDGVVLARVPLKALLREGDTGPYQTVNIDSCEIRVIGVPTSDVISKIEVAPGDHILSKIPTSGRFKIEFRMSNNGFYGVQSIDVINSNDEIAPRDPAVPPFGLPSVLYQHTHNSLVITVPESVSVTGVAIKNVEYSVAIVGGVDVVASGTISKGKQQRILLPPSPGAPNVQSINVVLKTEDVKGGHYESSSNIKRLSSAAVPPMPAIGFPSLLTTARHRLILRIPSRLTPQMDPIINSNTTLATCKEKNRILWYTTTQGGGVDIEVPSEVVDPSGCYRVVSAVSNGDGTVWPFRWLFDVPTAELDPLPLEGNVEVVPVGGGTIVVRVPTFRPHEKAANWEGQTVSLTISNILGQTILSKPLNRGSDNVFTTPCWSQDCKIKISRFSNQGKSVDLETSMKGSLPAMYRFPTDPDVFTSSSTTIVLVNPISQRVSIRIEERDSGNTIFSSHFDDEGHHPINRLNSGVSYVVYLMWSRDGERQQLKLNIKTSRSVASVSFNLLLLPAPDRIILQLPSLSEGQPIAEAKLTIREYSDDSRMLQNVTSQQNVVESDDDMIGSEDFNSNSTTTSIVPEIPAVGETVAYNPAPGEQMVITGLQENHRYTATIEFINIKGDRDIKVLDAVTSEFPYSQVSTHTVVDKELLEDGTLTLSVVPKSPIPDKFRTMFVAHEDESEKIPVFDYNGIVREQSVKVTGLKPDSRYRIAFSLQSPSLEYFDSCAHISTDLHAGAEHGTKSPVVLRVTSNEVVIFLPVNKELSQYHVSRVIRDSRNREVQRIVMYQGFGEKSKRGNVFIARALASDTQYTFIVQGEKKDGNLLNPIAVTARTDSTFLPCLIGRPVSPEPPQVISGTLVRYARKLMVLWAPVDRNEGDNSRSYNVTSYAVEAVDIGHNTTEQTFPFQIVKTTTPTEPYFTYPNLVPGHRYRLRVIAYNVWGQSPFGPHTDFVIPSEEPESPVMSLLSQESKVADLAWTVPYHNGIAIDEYRIECSPETNQGPLVYPSQQSIGDVWETIRKGSMFNDHTVLDLVPARNYSCRASAHNVVGWSKPSSIVSFWTKSDVPEPVSSLEAKSVGRYYAEIHFEKPRHNGLPILGYDVEISRPGQTFKILDVCDDITTNVCRVGSLLPGDQFSFRVNSENCLGTSVWSNMLTFSTKPAPPDPTTDFKLGGAMPRQLVFMWATGRNNGKLINQHAIECDNGLTCLSGAWNRPAPPPCVFSGNFTALPGSADPNNPINDQYSRIVWKKAVGPDEDPSLVTAAVPRLRPATTYRCRSYAINDEGFSNKTNVLVVRTDDTVPDAPLAQLINETYHLEPSDCAVYLTWPASIPNGQPVQLYTVWRKNVTRTMSSTGMPVFGVQAGEEDGGLWESVSSSLDLFVTIDRLRPDSDFLFKVSGKNSLGYGPDTIIKHHTHAGRPEAPLAPRLNQRGPTFLDVTCDPTDDGGNNIISYMIELAAGPTSQVGQSTDMNRFKPFELVHNWTFTDNVPGDGHSHIILGNLEQGTEYLVRCYSGNQVGMSNPSEHVMLATEASVPDAPPAPVPLGESYRTDSSLSLQILLPDDNGQRISRCVVEISGAWEWAIDGFPQIGANTPQSTPIETISVTVPVSYPYPTVLSFNTRTDVSSSRPCKTCYFEGSVNHNQLLASHKYSLRVSCANPIGSGSFGSPLLLRTLGREPNAPKIPTVTSQQESVSVQMDHPFGYGVVISGYRSELQCVLGSCNTTMCQSIDPITFECIEPSTVIVQSCSPNCGNVVDCEACAISHLRPGTQYRLRTTAQNEYGWSTPGNFTTFKTLSAQPLPVLGIQVSATPDTVTVQWTAPFNQGQLISAYHVSLICDTTQSECSDILLSNLGPSSRVAHISGVVPGAHYITLVNAENSHGKSSDTPIPVWVPACPPTGIPTPKLSLSSAYDLQLRLLSPEKLYTASVTAIQLSYAEMGSRTWITKDVTPLGDETVTIVNDLVSGKLYVFRMRVKGGGEACSLTGNTCDQWSEWSPISGPMALLSGCPSYLGQECAGRGTCDTVTSKCLCVGNYMGDDCSIPYTVGNTCTLTPASTTRLYDSTTFSLPVTNISEYLLYRNSFQSEQINIVKSADGPVGLAVMFQGHTMLISLNVSDIMQCPKVVHNCRYDVSSEWIFDPTTGWSQPYTIYTHPVSQRTVTLRGKCNGYECRIRYENSITETVIDCRRSSPMSAFSSCDLRPRRRMCIDPSTQTVPAVGYNIFPNRRISDTTSLITQSNNHNPNNCGRWCTSTSGCAVSEVVPYGSGYQCRLYRQIAMAHTVEAPGWVLGFAAGNTVGYITRGGTSQYSTSIAPLPEEVSLSRAVHCCDRTTGTVVKTAPNTCAFTTFSQAAEICDTNGYTLCTSAQLSTNQITSNCDSHRAWTSTAYETPLNRSVAWWCSYEGEEGMCGLEGSKMTSRAIGEFASSVIQPVSDTEGLFKDLDGNTCNVWAVGQSASASTGVTANVLVQSSMAVSSPVHDILGDDDEDDDVVEPILVSNDDMTLIQLSEPTTQHHATPLGMTSHIGVIDSSLRPKGHIPLGFNQNLIPEVSRTSVSLNEFVAPGRLLSRTVQNVPKTEMMARSVENLEKHDEPEMMTEISLDNSDVLAIPSTKFNALQTQKQLISALFAQKHHKNNNNNHNNNHLVASPHIQSVTSAQKHQVKTTSFHAMTLSPMQGNDEYEHGDLHQMLLVQSGTQENVMDGSRAVVCDEGCDVTLCEIAKKECAAFTMCVSSCVTDICSKKSVLTVKESSRICEEAALELQEMNMRAQKALESAAARFSHEDHEELLSQCPAFVAGDEPWNVHPLDEAIPAWTAQTFDVGVNATISATTSNTNGTFVV